MSKTDEALFFRGSRGMQRVYNLDATDEEVTLSGENLSDIAALLLGIRQDRTDSLQVEKHQIDDVSFHVMLDLMVSRNAGKSVTLQDLSINHGVRSRTMVRYVDYLDSVGLIYKTRSRDNSKSLILELTDTGLEICNGVLRKIDQRLSSL